MNQRTGRDVPCWVISDDLFKEVTWMMTKRQESEELRKVA